MSQDTAPLIVPHTKRSAGSTAILEHLARLWPMDATRVELDAVFSQAEPGRHHIPVAKRLSMALSNLRNSGQLIREGSGKASKFILGPGAQLISKDKPEPAKAAKPVEPAKQAKPSTVGERTKARDYDALTCPVYQPKPWPVNRAGAQDFKTAPSVGTHC